MFWILSVFCTVYVLGVNGTPCTLLESVDITNGTLMVDTNSITYNGVVYLSDERYKITEGGQTLIFGCPCIRHTCLWKCCGDGEAFLGKTCNVTDIPSANPFNPPVYDGTVKQILANDHFHYMYNKLCDERYLVDTVRDHEDIYIQQNGTLYEVASGGTQWLAPGVFCVDMLVDEASSEPRMVAAVCYPEYDDTDDQDDGQILYTAYAIGLILSVPFLLLTFLVYALIPELRNLHGLCLMAYCAGLLVGYPLLAYLKLQTQELSVNMTGCLVIAFIIYYAFQSSFFWVNVMCFDIWRTFSGYRVNLHRRQEMKRFIMYGAYAWGVPAILTAVTAAMQFSKQVPRGFRPRFGELKCWFAEWRGELLYFYTPVLVLVVCDSILFGITAWRIRTIKQETAILKGSEYARSDRLNKDKQRFSLYLKLFMVMGINWAVELFSFILGGSNWYWAVIDLSNIGLGFFIFLIFVWKNKVRNLLLRRLQNWQADHGASETAGERWTTRSSTAHTENTRVSSETPVLPLKNLSHVR